MLVNNNYQTKNYHRNNDKNDNEKLAEKTQMDHISQVAIKVGEELEKLESLQRYTQRRLHRHLWTQ